MDSALFDLPNLRHLNGLAAVVQTRHLSAAAARVGLSQPALTQAVAAIEARAGTQLFDRAGGGIAPLEPALLLAARVNGALAQLRRALEGVGARPHLAPLLSLAHLRGFIAAVDHEGLRGGARALGCSLSTVSRSCRDLEGMLGVRLLERTSAGLRPTRAANEFARLARLALVEIHQGFEDVALWRGEASGRLGIGCLPLAQGGLLPRALARFAAEYPRVSVRVVDGYYRTLAHELRHGGIDLILGALRGADLPPDLVQERLFDDPLAVVARAGHPLAGRQGLTLGDLARHGWVMPRAGAPSRCYFERLMAESPACALAPVETGAPSVLRGLLRASDRVALVSQSQVIEELEQGILVRLDLPLPGSARAIGIATRAGWRPGQPQARFLAILRELAAEHGEGAGDADRLHRFRRGGGGLRRGVGPALRPAGQPAGL